MQTILLAATCLVAIGCGAQSGPATSLRVEAEDGKLQGGATVSTRRAGFSGRGYVTNLTATDAKVTMSLQARSGIYEAHIGYSAPSGQKGFGLNVNGSGYSGMFPATGDVFAVHSAGKVELKDGLNTVTIERGWGYFDVDYVEFVPATVAGPPAKPPKTPVDPKATPKARALLAALVDRYGKDTLSGQFVAADTDYIAQATGKTPAIYGDDLIDYSPSRVAIGGMPKDVTEKAIARARAGQILTLTWHWNAPKDLVDKETKDEQGRPLDARWYKGFYTYATTFDLQRALDGSDPEGKRLLLRDIDAIAAQLKKVADADVPVLWRPLHEAEGGWFWWGAKGPAPFVQLWRLLYHRLTDVHGLHNLIWVFTAGEKPAWYPGDAFVDAIGVDAYPTDKTDPLSNTWESMQRQYGGRKLVGISEFGGVPDVERMRRFGAYWSFFVSWTGTVRAPGMAKEDVERIYRSRFVVTKESLK